MNVTEKMHRIQLAANEMVRCHAAPVRRGVPPAVGTSSPRMMVKLNESERDEFSVAVFHCDGTHKLHEALGVAAGSIHLAKRAGSTFDRVIITDGGDDTVFCWEHGKGITWPEHRL